MSSLPDRAPVARHVVDAKAGQLLSIQAVVVSADTLQIGPSASYQVTLREGDAELDLLFLGRPIVRGFAIGTSCRVTGRATARHGRLVVWNPRYQLLPAPTGAAALGPPTVKPQSRTTVTSLVSPITHRDFTSQADVHQAIDDAAVAPAGRFRIYLGPAAGVGKTYAMLNEAHRRLRRGSDVVVAIVDTHERPATAAQLSGLEVVPPKTVRYRGGVYQEMDLDAVLARRPDVALVDELAHTNIPGSGRNEKRWQDVLDLLAANISVITTVNVQHIESLADVVEHITGVTVHERVPDTVLQQADQIELVDSSPEQLRRRMLHGNIYPADRARQALHGFFRTDTLAALRELTLRFLADEIDDELIERLAAGGPASRGIAERVLVGVTPAAGADMVLRRAARVAARLKADLYAVHVRAADTRQSDPDAVAGLHELADDLGAHWCELDGDPVTVIMDFAQQHQITQIVVGGSQRSRWQRVTGGGSTVRRLTRRAMAVGIDMHIVARDQPSSFAPRRAVTPRSASDNRT